jgi:hypothetical protein
MRIISNISIKTDFHLKQLFQPVSSTFADIHQNLTFNAQRNMISIAFWDTLIDIIEDKCSAKIYFFLLNTCVLFRSHLLSMKKPIELLFKIFPCIQMSVSYLRISFKIGFICVKSFFVNMKENFKGDISTSFIFVSVVISPTPNRKKVFLGRCNRVMEALLSLFVLRPSIESISISIKNIYLQKMENCYHSKLLSFEMKLLSVENRKSLFSNELKLIPF